LVSEFGCPHVFITLTCNPKWPEIVSQLLDGQTAFDRPHVTVAVFKSKLDQMKMNIRNGKYFDGHEPTYTFHVIEYQYHGLPHAHLVARLDDANDIDDPNCEDLINFVNKHFAAEMPHFDREEFQNIYAMDGALAYMEQYKQKAVEMVCMNNTHRCATSINGCKRDANNLCKRGYSRSGMISETYVNQVTNRIVYQRWMECNLKIIPYNLPMIMDWDSHINVEYSCLLIVLSTCTNIVTRAQQGKSILIWVLSKSTIPWMRFNCSNMAESS
jgi:hypothetical protein